MSLVNLTTNLKSLHYGKDQLGGGYSGQPYIQVPIPVGFNNLQLSNNDFILRGGAFAARDSATDVLRLGKMFANTKSPSGLLFIAKQNLLSRTAVRTQASGILNEGIYTPLSTLTEAGLVAFGGHVNKQGINPFAGTGAYSNNPNLYGVKVQNNQPIDENRLVNLYQAQQINFTSKSFGSGVTLNKGNVNVLSYTGGPGSILGIGKTHIRFADQRTGEASGHSPKYLFGLPNGNGAIGSDTDRTDISLNYRNALGLSVSSSYYENGNSSLPIIDLSTQKNTGISEDGVGVGTYYVGVPNQPSNVTIGNLIGNNARTYQALKHNVINIFDNYQKISIMIAQF